MGDMHRTDAAMGPRLVLRGAAGCGGKFILANPTPAREHRAIILYSSAATTNLDNAAIADRVGHYRWSRYQRAMTLPVMWGSLIAQFCVAGGDDRGWNRWFQQFVLA
jgi:hypothetical protein